MNLFIDKNIISTKILLEQNNENFDFKYTFFDEENIIGNVYLGRIRNITKNMKALFIDIGLEKNAYLDFNDLLNGNDFNKNYHVGKEIIVQVKKNPIGDKGAKVSEKISLSSENIVLLPHDSKIYISKKINKAKLRYDLREYFNDIIADNGLIIRTNALDVPFDELKKEFLDLKYLWDEIERQKVIKSNETLVYSASTEYDSFIIDYYNEIEMITVNSKKIYDSLISKYNSTMAIVLDENLSLKDTLVSFVNQNIQMENGIHLNIEQTEALTIIDVNSGKYISQKDLNGIYKVNSIALKEIAKQLNLKSISGIILIDLINFSNNALGKKLINELKMRLEEYKNKVSIFGFTETGLLELTKQYKDKDLLSLVTNKSKDGINNRFFNEKYFADLIISEIKRILYSTNSKKLGVYCNEEIIDFMKKEKIIQDYFKKNDLIIEYTVSKDIKIKHLPFKKGS